jgi:uncharacterized surface protein with fasciclin (FAS1) repeats
MRHLILTLAILSTIGITLAAGEQRPTVYQGLFGADSDPELASFATALRDNFGDEDLRRWFDGEAHSTVFAPTEQAVDKFLAALADGDLAVDADPSSALEEHFLRRHIVEGDWPMSEKGQPPAGMLQTIDDNIANVHRDGEVLKIDEARILRQRRYANGVIMQVDQVLAGPESGTSLGCSPFTSKHYNYLDLKSFDALSIDWTGHSITNCQPWGYVKVNSATQVLVYAGRHDSSGPANWFKSGLTSDNMNPTASGGSLEPADLNFAVAGNMTATVGGVAYQCDDVRFGQGSFQSANNWWVGQPKAIRCPSLPDCDGVYDGVPLVLDCSASDGSARTIWLSNDLGTEPSDVDYLFEVGIGPAGTCPPC